VKANALPYGDNYEVLREHLDDETAALVYVDGPSTPERAITRRREYTRGFARDDDDDDDDERGSRCRRARPSGSVGTQAGRFGSRRTLDAATQSNARSSGSCGPLRRSSLPMT
jgi:hypothetical protein